MQDMQSCPVRKALGDLHGLRVRFAPPSAAASCACGFWAFETGERGAQSVVSAYEAHRAACNGRTTQTPGATSRPAQAGAERFGRAA